MAFWIPRSPRQHEALHRAVGDAPVTLGDQEPVQHDVHLAGPERRIVLRMNRP